MDKPTSLIFDSQYNACFQELTHAEQGNPNTSCNQESYYQETVC
jgi:hypothetical protein